MQPDPSGRVFKNHLWRYQCYAPDSDPFGGIVPRRTGELKCIRCGAPRAGPKPLRQCVPSDWRSPEEKANDEAEEEFFEEWQQESEDEKRYERELCQYGCKCDRDCYYQPGDL